MVNDEQLAGSDEQTQKQAMGRAIERMRERRGLTKTQLAERVSGEVGLSWSRHAVRELEDGERSLSVHELLVVAWALDCSPDVLALPDPDEVRADTHDEGGTYLLDDRPWVALVEGGMLHLDSGPAGRGWWAGRHDFDKDEVWQSSTRDSRVEWKQSRPLAERALLEWFPDVEQLRRSLRLAERALTLFADRDWPDEDGDADEVDEELSGETARLNAVKHLADVRWRTEALLRQLGSPAPTTPDELDDKWRQGARLARERRRDHDEQEGER